MAGAVHGLERKLVVLNWEYEHVVFVVRPVTRLFPEFRVEHIGRDN